MQIQFFISDIDLQDREVLKEIHSFVSEKIDELSPKFRNELTDELSSLLGDIRWIDNEWQSIQKQKAWQHMNQELKNETI